MEFNGKIFKPLFWKQLLYFKIFIGIHTLPYFIIRRWQFRQIRPLLWIAYSRVPFYRKQWEERGIHPADIKNLEDFWRIPVTAKDLFRQQRIFDCMVSDLPERMYYWKHTSGSSGDPFSFPSNSTLYFRRNFYLLTFGDIYINRFLYWLGVSLKKVTDYKVAELRVNNRPRVKEYLHLPISGLREDPQGLVQNILQFKPDILDGRSTALVELARVFSKIGLADHTPVKYFVSHGEELSPTQRDFIEGVFGTKVYNRYGLEEIGDIAIECSRHDGMHIHEESFLVEILDEKNQSLSAGEWGRVVVTNFFSFVMPFIRYDTGDTGMIMPGKCSCGVSARKLHIAGRRQARFFNLGQKKFNTGELEVIISDFSSLILRCQAAKISEEKLEIRIIPADNYLPDDIYRLAGEMREKIGIEPIIKIADTLPFSSSGKTQFFIDETKPVST